MTINKLWNTYMIKYFILKKKQCCLKSFLMTWYSGYLMFWATQHHFLFLRAAWFSLPLPTVYNLGRMVNLDAHPPLHLLKSPWRFLLPDPSFPHLLQSRTRHMILSTTNWGSPMTLNLENAVEGQNLLIPVVAPNTLQGLLQKSFRKMMVLSYFKSSACPLILGAPKKPANKLFFVVVVKILKVCFSSLQPENPHTYGDMLYILK